jgi:hypothetical protein
MLDAKLLQLSLVFLECAPAESENLHLLRASVSRLPLVPKRKHVDGVISGLMAIKRDIALVCKRDNQFAQLREIWQRSSDRRMRLQEHELPHDDLGRPPGRFGTASSQVLPASLQASRGPFGDDYSWHSGGSASDSLPHVSSQARTSSAVRWRPVSRYADQDASAS